VFNK